MEENTSFAKKLKNTIGGRLIIICILVLLLNIPLSLVENVIYSRSYLYSDATDEISADWGGAQTIVGPILTIPVSFKVETQSLTKKGVTTTSYQYVDYQILPENLNIKAEIKPELRHRGIFDVLVQKTFLEIDGSFSQSPLSELQCDNCTIQWNQAKLNFGINSELIRDDMDVTFDGKKLDNVTAGTNVQGLKGISFKIDVTKLTSNNFDMKLSFNNSGTTSFAPVGKKTLINVSSSWPHPKFGGTFRPDHPKINETGFDAKWNIPHIARSYPQIFTNGDGKIGEVKSYMASIDLFEPLGIYKKVQRLVNYGIMFIALTFIMMFLFEIRLRKNMHIAQYLVVGLAVSMFFLTTLSFSEHIGFDWAYLSASVIVILLISLYILAAMRSKKAALVGGGIMAILYAILYIMLSEADYALLIGTVILLITIAAIMWETRNINQTENP